MTSIFSTRCQREAYSLMTVAANTSAAELEAALALKRAIVEEIHSRQLIDEGVLKTHPCLYVGSSCDLMFPLLLGARKITLLDPVFRYESEAFDEVSRGAKLVSVDGIVVATEVESISFQFDFGQGGERVDLQVVPQRYPALPLELLEEMEYAITPEEKAISKELTKTCPLYSAPGEPFGMIMCFRPSKNVFLSCDRATIKCLVSGGYIFSDVVSECLSPENLTEGQLCALRGAETMSGLTEIYQEAYNASGYDFIPLNSELALTYTFLRKQ